MSKSETENSRAIGTRVKNFSAAIAALQRGDVIVYPTETLYGLGADALDAAAVEKIFQLKGRDSKNPIPILVANRQMLDRLATEVPPLAEKLIACFWPGPLTIVLPAREKIPRPLVNLTGGVGVRISSEPIAAELVNALGGPLTATSANPSGKAPARTVGEAKDYFAGQIEFFIDGKELTSKSGSTVVEIIGGALRIIREGEIGKSALQRIIGKGKILL